MRNLFRFLAVFLALALPVGAQSTPINNPRLTGEGNFSGLSNKPVVVSQLGIKEMQTFADDAARTTAVPAYLGQIGLQLNTSQLFQGTTLGAGFWGSGFKIDFLQISGSAAMVQFDTGGHIWNLDGEVLMKSPVGANTLTLNGGSAAPAKLTLRNTGQTATGTVIQPGASGAITITLPSATGTVATLAGNEALTNKTIVLTSPLAVSSGGNRAKSVFRTSSLARTSTTTLANDSQLTLAVESGKTYIVTAELRFDMASVTPGVKIAFAGPANTRCLIGLLVTNGAAFYERSNITTLTTALTHNGITLINYQISGLVTFSASGNLVLQWSQATSSADATTIANGTFLRVEEIP